MALAGPYRKVFSMEASVMSVLILGSLQKLEQNPSSAKEIMNLKRYADVIMGDAKFLGKKDLERHAKMILSLFSGDQVTEQKSQEIAELIMQFKKFVK